MKGVTTSSSSAVKHGLYVLLEKILRWSVNPRFRAKLLALLGAHIGRNVRIYEVQLFNLQNGFANLHIDDDVHIGIGCRLDLAGELRVGARSTLSPGVTILTHNDCGSAHGSKLIALYPAEVASVSIGEDSWIGANATVLSGGKISSLVVVAAGSVVSGVVPTASVAAGAPARVKKRLSLDS